MPVDPIHIQEAGQYNPAGLLISLFLSGANGFTQLAQPKNNPSNPADLVSIQGSHQCGPNHCFIKVELEINKNELNFEHNSGVLGSHPKTSLSGFLSNTSPAILGTLDRLKNLKLIAIILTPDLQMIQMGVDGHGATLSFNHQTGSDEGGERGSSLTLTSYHPPLLYNGYIRRDKFSHHLTDLANRSSGTIWGAVEMDSLIGGTLLSLWDNAGHDRLDIYINGAQQLEAAIYAGNTLLESITTTHTVQPGITEYALSYDLGGSLRLSLNGRGPNAVTFPPILFQGPFFNFIQRPVSFGMRHLDDAALITPSDQATLDGYSSIG